MASQRLGLASQRLVLGARNWVREQSEECGASKLVSGASKKANSQASGIVLSSRSRLFLTTA